MLFDATVEGRTVRVEVRPQGQGYVLSFEGRSFEVDRVAAGPHFASLLVAGRSHEVAIERSADGLRLHFPADIVSVRIAEASRSAPNVVGRPSGPQRITAPMPGRVVRVLVLAGAEVQPGDGLLVIEAMKMENELRAPRAGRIAEVAVQEGQAVEAGALVVVIT